MVKIKLKEFIIFFLIYSISDINSKEIIDIELNNTKYGALQNNEYDYYKLTLSNEIEKDNYLIFELKQNKILDSISNIFSDPNLYISIEEKYPDDIKNTWSSKRFGDETISISSNFLKSKQSFYIGIFCREKCNYILKAQLVKNIQIKENQSNTFNFGSKTTMSFSFETRKNFENLSVNIMGSYINSFNVYLGQKDVSSSNTLSSVPIMFNGYQFIIKNDNNNNSAIIYQLIIDNNEQEQEIIIWLKYDNENIKINEAEIIYESIPEKNISCYNYPIDNYNKDKDIILSIIIFNGYGFIHLGEFKTTDIYSIDPSVLNEKENYQVFQNKVIKLTKEEVNKYKKYDSKKNIIFPFCFYAEKNTSLSMKMYMFENYKKIQSINKIYPGIGIEDIIPGKSVTKYKLEHFDIEKDLSIYLSPKEGKSKLYLYLELEGSNFIDKDNFNSLKKTDRIIEAQPFNAAYYLIFKKESNKCIKNKKTNLNSCYLYIIVDCENNEDCIFSINFDHTKEEIKMKPKEIYSNVISEEEYDYYSITITDSSVKNIAIILTQNTGKTILSLEEFKNEDDYINLSKDVKNNDYLPNIIKISANNYNLDNLKGIFSLKVIGLSYAYYSLYYYAYNDEDNLNYLDYDKVSMKLEKGKIIKDVFMNEHIFKIYLYDSSTNGNKSDLFIVLVETDYVDYELYVFKNLNDFTINEDMIYGYLWKGEVKDFIYIDKNDKKYINNDILYIMIYKKTKQNNIHKNNAYTTFYLGITDENIPFILNEAIEFKHQLNKQHKIQKFLYYYINNENEDNNLQISLSNYYGNIYVKISIEKLIYSLKHINDDGEFFVIKKNEIINFCKNKKQCEVEIEIKIDEQYLSFASFLISIRSTKNTAIILKEGIIDKRTILTGEDQHFIIEIKPDQSFGAKISAFFSNGQGILFARKLLKSELNQVYNFPDEQNYEYIASFKSINRGFYIIDIPYNDLFNLDPCKILLTVRGIFPGNLSTKIEYSLSVSNTINDIITDKSYKLFISKGEIKFFHFIVGTNKKRLYISMTNKDKDANFFLNYDKYFTNFSDYEWKNNGAYNEYLDISIEDPFFVERNMKDIDGDYYLAIQGLEDTFFDLYISSQDIKITTINQGEPAACTCESENEVCYFRYENLNYFDIQYVFDQKLIFYTEFTYGSGILFGKLYPNGNMDDIIKNLPKQNKSDYYCIDSDEFLYVTLTEGQNKYTISSVIVMAVQCKEKSLFDLNAVQLDKITEQSKFYRNLIFLKLNQDNIFYLSQTTGFESRFIFYISDNEDLNFQLKALLGKAEIHTFTNDTKNSYKFSDDEERKMSINNYHHISDFILDNYIDDKKYYYGNVPKNYGYKNYFYVEVKPIKNCLININLYYNNYMVKLPLNKEVIGMIRNNNYYCYFDFLSEIEEVYITIKSLSKNRQYNVYLKTNILTNNNQEELIYSKPSNKNYDLKGNTNLLTSSVSFRLKNIPDNIRKQSNIVRVLLNIQSDLETSNHQKIKINISPIINNINKIKAKQKTYYYSSFENIKTEKTLFILSNKNKDDNLIIIEISSCKGDFKYAITDIPPLDTESYNQLKKREVESNDNHYNGKTIITIKNVKVKQYYLMLFGKKNELDIFIDDEKEEKTSEVDVLFYYYTINERQYNYLVTQDSLIYESKDNFNSIELKLPELKKRDIFGKENIADNINYTVIVSNNKKDLLYMESTCYLTKLEQKRKIHNEFDYLNIEIDKKSNIIKVKEFKSGQSYYLNVLAKNEKTGEIITYKMVIINISSSFKMSKIIIYIFLIITILVCLYIAFILYRKNKIQKLKIDFIKDSNESHGKNGNISKFNLNIIKNKYNELKEDNHELNDN